MGTTFRSLDANRFGGFQERRMSVEVDKRKAAVVERAAQCKGSCPPHAATPLDPRHPRILWALSEATAVSGARDGLAAVRR